MDYVNLEDQMCVQWVDRYAGLLDNLVKRPVRVLPATISATRVIYSHIHLA